MFWLLSSSLQPTNFSSYLNGEMMEKNNEAINLKRDPTTHIFVGFILLCAVFYLLSVQIINVQLSLMCLQRAVQQQHKSGHVFCLMEKAPWHGHWTWNLLRGNLTQHLPFSSVPVTLRAPLHLNGWWLLTWNWSLLFHLQGSKILNINHIKS